MTPGSPGSKDRSGKSDDQQCDANVKNRDILRFVALQAFPCYMLIQWKRSEKMGPRLPHGSVKQGHVCIPFLLSTGLQDGG